MLLPFLAPLLLPLLLSLVQPSIAAVYVEFDMYHQSREWWDAPDTMYNYHPNIGNLANCVAAADSDAAYGYQFAFNACFTYTYGYPKVCSGIFTNGGWVSGIVDRCSGTPGYVLSGEGSCIYTGGAALTDAAYASACPTQGGAPAALASPAYKRKRTVVVQSAFVGGKICPIGEQACPLKKGFECVNVKDNLNSCGGCIGGTGVDCSDLAGTDEVACESGSCVVRSCIRGFSLSLNGSCLPK